MTDSGTGVRLRDSLHDVTHLVFAAYQEQPSLAGQVAPNVKLLEGSLDALAAAGAPLQHVILYQGNKYYGAHLGPFKTPAREDDPRLPGPNFYYDQEDLLRVRAEREGFAFTIFRPEAVCGVATGNPMNLLTAIAVYATCASTRTSRCDSPAPSRSPTCCTRSPTPVCSPAQPRGRDWRRASQPGLQHHQRRHIPLAAHVPPHSRLLRYRTRTRATVRLTDHMPSQEGDWEEIATLHRLEPTPFHELAAWEFADFIFHSSWDNVSSTIKIRQAGFPECIDSEHMFIELFDTLAVRNLIPRR